MNILNVFGDPTAIGGSERSMHLAAAAMRDAGHRIFLLHGAAPAARFEAQYDAELRAPDIFDRRSILSPAGLGDAHRQVDAFIADNRIDLLHVQGNWPRTEVITRWTARHVVVVTTHLVLCPTNARYHWKDRCVCDRAIGLGCFTTGYLRKGCGHLGNGKPYGLAGFVRGMADDHRLRKALAGAHAVISPSRWLRERLIRDGFPANSLHVLHPPMQGADAAPAAVQSDEPPVVLFVGRLNDFKAPDHLLQASKRISIPHRIWIIGDGPMRGELETLSRQLEIAHRVEFFGMLPPDKINEKRLASSVAVVPSLLPESFAMVGAEAMLSASPVVAYDVGGVGEWAKDGVTGRLVEPGNIAGLASAIEELLANPALARRMGQSGVAFARRFSVENHAAGLTQIYQNALAAGHPAVGRPAPFREAARA